MSLLAKSAIAATVISAGSAVTAHQLIQNKSSDSASEQQPIDSNTSEIEEQKKIEPEQQITKPQTPTTKRTNTLPPRPSTSQRLEHTSKPAISAASIPAGSIFDRSRFFGHSGKNTPSRVNSIEFKPIEGRDRPT